MPSMLHDSMIAESSSQSLQEQACNARSKRPLKTIIFSPHVVIIISVGPTTEKLKAIKREREIEREREGGTETDVVRARNAQRDTHRDLDRQRHIPDHCDVHVLLGRQDSVA